MADRQTRHTVKALLVQLANQITAMDVTLQQQVQMLQRLDRRIASITLVSIAERSASEVPRVD